MIMLPNLFMLFAWLNDEAKIRKLGRALDGCDTRHYGCCAEI
jgi:hypothetical protein